MDSRLELTAGGQASGIHAGFADREETLTSEGSESRILTEKVL